MIGQLALLDWKVPVTCKLFVIAFAIWLGSVRVGTIMDVESGPHCV